VIGERGDYYRYYGDEEQSLALYSEAWKIFKNISPPNDPSAHSYGLTLAEIYCAAGRHEEGLAVIDEVEEGCRDYVKDSFVRCMYLRGWAHILREDYAAAASTLQAAVKLAKEHLEESHAYTLLSRFHLARTLDALGRQAEAQEQFQTVLPLTRERVQLPNARQMELFAHAWSLLHGGSTDEQTLREALDAAEQGLERAAVWPQYGSGPHLHLAKAIAQYKLAKLRQQGIGSAVKTLRAALNQHAFIPLRPRHKHVPMSRHELEVQLAEWLVEQGNESEAERALSDAVELRREHFGEDHPKVALAELRLGDFLIERGEFDRAEELLRAAYEKLTTNSQAADASRERAATLMAAFLGEEGRHDEMAAWQAKAESHGLPSKDNGTK
jgi:tetratricopeptide (TPR) repeat protein